MGHRDKRPFVMMVDDDPEDVMLTRDAIKEVAPKVKFGSLADGQELMEYLFAKSRGEAKRPCPELIFLDLNMPRKNGFEVLDAIRTDPDLKGIPIVVLSTSLSSEDITRSYKLGANTFIPKPGNYGELLTVMSQAMNYWFGISRLPSIC